MKMQIPSLIRTTFIAYLLSTVFSLHAQNAPDEKLRNIQNIEWAWWETNTPKIQKLPLLPPSAAHSWVVSAIVTPAFDNEPSWGVCIWFDREGIAHARLQGYMAFGPATQAVLMHRYNSKISLEHIFDNFCTETIEVSEKSHPQLKLKELITKFWSTKFVLGEGKPWIKNWVSFTLDSPHMQLRLSTGLTGNTSSALFELSGSSSNLDIKHTDKEDHPLYTLAFQIARQLHIQWLTEQANNNFANVLSNEQIAIFGSALLEYAKDFNSTQLRQSIEYRMASQGLTHRSTRTLPLRVTFPAERSDSSSPTAAPLR